MISDLDETAVNAVNPAEQIINCESDSDSGVEEAVGLNNVDENLDNVSANNKCKQVLNKTDLEEIKRYNLKIRASIYKEVRRFGRSKFLLHAYLTYNSTKNGPEWSVIHLLGVVEKFSKLFGHNSM